MPTVNILPNFDHSNSPAWTLSTGSDIWALLDDDHTSTPTGDGSLISATAQGKVCDIGFQSLADVGVATEDIDTIDSVQGVIKANVYERGKSYELRMQIIRGADGGLHWDWDTTGSINSSGSWNTHTFTQRDGYASGQTGWSGSMIDAIRMNFQLYSLTAGGTMRVTYAYFIVGYTSAVTADNATFFGTNF